MTRRFIFAAALIAVAFGSACSTVNPDYDPAKPHHRPDGFQNIDPQALMPRPFGDFMRWQRNRWSLDIPPPKMDLTPITPELDFLRANKSEFAATWIGHATVLVQIPPSWRGKSVFPRTGSARSSMPGAPSPAIPRCALRTGLARARSSG